MAKKTRRARRRSAAQTPSRATTARRPVAPQAAEPAAPLASVATASKEGVDFRAEYAYVLTDLKRIAIIAVTMLVVLVALSYLIR
ncbi:MAG: hypothetical protein ACUVXG_11855 [Anaerolineae bacterium]